MVSIPIERLFGPFGRMVGIFRVGEKRLLRFASGRLLGHNENSRCRYRGMA